MIKIRATGAIIGSLFRGTIDAHAVVKDQLPEDATLSSAMVDHSSGYPTLVLYFDDGEDEVRELEPVFERIHLR